MSSTVTRLNIPVTHLLKLWMENRRTIGSWSQYPGLVINEINNIGKRIKRIRIIENVVLTSGWDIYVCWTRASSDSRVIERRDTKENNNIGGPRPPSNHIF